MSSSRSRGPDRPAHVWGWTAAKRRMLGVIVLLSALLTHATTERLPEENRSAPILRVNPNEAPVAVLSALPRIGPVLAGRIAAAREVAPLRSLDEIDRRIRGIGPVTSDSIRPYLRFEAATPNVTSH